MLLACFTNTFLRFALTTEFVHKAVVIMKRNVSQGRAIAQAVSRWLPTAARVRVRAENVGFVVVKLALGQVFCEYFSFPRQSSFHQFLHHHNHLGLAQ
jgi:hypothetical protein